jgi:hypothetical protein
MSNTTKKLRGLEDTSLADKALDDKTVKGVQTLLRPMASLKSDESLYLLGCAFMVAQLAAREGGMSDDEARLIGVRSAADGKRIRFGAPKLRNKDQELSDTKAENEKLKAELAALKK